VLVPIASVHLGIGLALVVVSVPLVMRRVPMNRVYGVRVREAFVSERNWYEINAYGGRLFAVFGVLLMAIGWWGRRVAPPPESPMAPVYLVVPLLALVPVLALIRARARRLPDR
jgi:hypothetical protein